MQQIIRYSINVGLSIHIHRNCIQVSRYNHLFIMHKNDGIGILISLFIIQTVYRTSHTQRPGFRNSTRLTPHAPNMVLLPSPFAWLARNVVSISVVCRLAGRFVFGTVPGREQEGLQYAWDIPV